MAADSLTTTAALNAEIQSRTVGDARLAVFVGSTLSGGVPSGDAPKYSNHGVLISLTDGDNLELSIWKLDNAKQGKIAIQDDGVTIISNPAHINFSGALNDGFKVTASGGGARVQLDALGHWWSGTSPDGLVEQIIQSTGTMVEFEHERFMTGIQVDKILIGHISAAWSVVGGIRAKGRRVKVGVNP